MLESKILVLLPTRTEMYDREADEENKKLGTKIYDPERRIVQSYHVINSCNVHAFVECLDTDGNVVYNKCNVYFCNGDMTTVPMSMKELFNLFRDNKIEITILL